MNDYNFPKKLTALRTAKGMTQTAVAEALGISDKTLSKWENGSSSPDISMLATIAEYYDVSADELLGLTSTKTMSPESAIKKDELTRAITDLETLGLIQKREIDIDNVSKTLYYARQKHIIIALFLFAHELNHRNGYNLQYHSLDRIYLK